jgi:hypothetical protein
MRRRGLLASVALVLAAAGAVAQQGQQPPAQGLRPEQREPVAFTAGQLEFDERTNTVIASGGVEAGCCARARSGSTATPTASMRAAMSPSSRPMAASSSPRRRS